MADYIIVGGGPAGCAIAARLSEDASVRVTLLEAGGHDRHPLYHWPAGFAKMTKGIGSWGWSTVPQRHMQDRVLRYTQAKVIGGGSTINAQLYTRGNRLDYDEWAQAGCRGWAYEDVLPYFRRAEDNQRFSDDFHAYGGPIGVSMPVAPLPICDAFMRAAQELGIPYNHDFNGARQAGIGFYQLTQKNARRSSAATGYLGEAAGRANLTVRTGVEVLRIVVEKGRAVGVEIAENGGKLLLRAEREVIVSSGAIGSPRLLMLSGIGPADHLESVGVDVVHDLPGVGGNLQDHLGINYYYKASEPTLNSMLSPWWGKLLQGMRYVLFKRGPLGLSVNQCGGFVRSHAHLDRPDQQLYLNPVTYTTSPSNKRPIINPDPFAGFILSFQPSRPSSRGRIDIRSADPAAAPRIVPNYLSTQKDLDDVVAGGRLVQRMARTPAIRAFAMEAMAPDIEHFDDDAILEDFRQRCGSVFHPVSTCRMGRSEATAVVDANLRVFGIEGLRVADASAFPNITSGNTNAPTIMLAHRAASLILQDRPRGPVPIQT